jgi:ferredoxin
MKIIIDWDLCQGHGNCTGEAPEVFRLDEQGNLQLLIEDAPLSLAKELDLAVRYCPTGAIRVEG